ncbi:MAG: gamma-glutamyltransferase family protein [Hellea sp.]|nr:gamma-glutamyltransferase family protein [Hellea sp.]
MKALSGLLISAVLVVAGCKGKQAEETQIIPGVGITVATAPGMVAAANRHAVETGLEILREGGSAVDAAIAVQTVLGLVEPQSSGIAGGAFMIVYDNKTGDVWFYNGREKAPAGVSSDMFLDPETGEPIRYFSGITSGRSTGVPGVMSMLEKAHGDYGKLAWEKNFEPGIALAEHGFEISPRLAGLIKRAAGYGFGSDINAGAYFFDDNGEPHQVGFLRDNQPYAETLRALQDNPRALLEPPIANDIIAATQEEPLPGYLTLDDMAAYEAQKEPALCGDYRELTLCGAMPPASGSLAVLSILGTLENFDMAGLGNSAEGWHTFIEASFLSYADRDKYVADDDFVTVPIKEMLDKDYLKSRATLISMDSAMQDVRAGNPVDFVRGKDATPDSPGTSHFTIVDKDGLTVAMTTTVESVFGSQRMVRGFMLNNQLTDFSFRSHDDNGEPIANAVAPHKRPRSSMAPMIAFDADGEFLFTSGSPGGNSIIAYTAKSIVGIVDWGLTPQEAIVLPNVIARNGSVRLEENRLDAAIIEALEAKGHKVVRSQGEISGLHIIYRNPDGSYTGGADPRREGVALSE